MKKRNMLALCALVVGLVACATDPKGGGSDDDDDDDEIECGNNKCEDGETPKNCEEDCEDEGTCGNNMCETGEQTSCPGDCVTGPTCGDNKCEGNEAQTCPADCPVVPVCGNNKCEGNETSTCPQDCDVDPVCGNNVCEGTETSTCPTDCPAAVRLQNNSSYYIYNFYIAACGSPSWGPDQTGAAYIAPGYSFTVNRIPPGCYHFRATNYDSSLYWQTPSPVTLNPNVQYTWTLSN